MSATEQASGPKSAIGALLKRVLVVLAIALVPLIVLEGLLRVVGVAPIFDAHHAAMPDLPAEPELAQYPRFITDDDGFWVANPDLPYINEGGFRSPPLDEDPGERPTVVFIGDSFTWGESAKPLENSFVDLVRNAGYRTVNLGIMGIGPVQYAAMAEKFLPDLAPDAVVLVFYPGNDFEYEPPVTPGHPRYYLTEELILAAYSPDGAPWSFEESYSQFAGTLGASPAARLRRALYSSRLVSVLSGMVSDNDMRDKTLPTVIESIERLRAATLAVDATFELVIAPVRPELQDSQNNNTYCAQVLSAFDPQIPEGFDANCFAPMPDTHFNNHGHNRFAEFVLDELKARGLQPRPDDPTHVPVTPFGKDKKDLAWRAVVENLALDESQEAAMLAIINGLKDDFAEIFSQPTAEGGPSPLEVLAEALAEPGAGGESAAQQQFLRYGAEHREAKSTNNYFATLSDIAAARMADTRSVLSPRQQTIFNQRYVEHIFDIATNHDPVGSKVAEIAARDDGGLVSRKAQDRIADWPFEALVEHVALDPEEAAAARESIDALKRRFAEVFALPRSDGEPSPLEEMARLMQDDSIDEATRNAHFEDYARSHSPEGFAGSYFEVFSDAAKALHDAFIAGLTEAQRGRFADAPIASLMDVKTGYDPFGGRLMQMMTDAGVQRGDPEASMQQTWDALADKLQLDDPAREEIRGLIDELKAEYEAILRQPAASGNEAPAERLAALHAGEAPGDSRDFIQYLQEEREAITGETFASLLEKEELSIRRKIAALLNRSQRETFESTVSGSLSDINTAAQE